MAVRETVDLDAIDLYDVDVFADGPPYELFSAMRERAPVHRNPPGHDRDGFWSLTAYEDIVAVNKDWERFSSARRGSFLVEGGIVPKEFEPLLFNMMDPPNHDRHRGILQKVFTARAVMDREPDIRSVIDRLIDAVIERGECDFVRDLAVELPLTVTANMLGIPYDERGKLFEWTNQLADTSLSADTKLQTLGEVGTYLVGFIARLREHPTDDLLSQLVHAELDGERLNDGAGEVLVASTTDPSWASVMFVSAALVVDIGGPLSHAAVVARELGLPCVVNTRDGTSALSTGDLVRVDGGAGTVTVLETTTNVEA